MKCSEQTPSLSTATTHPPEPSAPSTASRTQEFPGVATSVGAARVWLGATLEALTVPTLVREDAALVLSELVSNAIAHTASCLAGGKVAVSLLLRHQVLSTELTVLVVDGGSSTVPRPREATPDAEHGRGLLLVEALSQDWGELADDSCGVWAYWSWPVLAECPSWARGWELGVAPNECGVRAHHPEEGLTLQGSDLPSLRERMSAVVDVRRLRELYPDWALAYDPAPEGPCWFAAQRKDPCSTLGRGQANVLQAPTVPRLRALLLGQVAADRRCRR